MRRIFASLAIAHIFFVVVATQSRTDDADAQLESRFRAFVQHVRCLVCQNEALSDSRAELAVDLRREIREQMKAGRSNEEITAFLTDRYGDFVLYRPPLKPTTSASALSPVWNRMSRIDVLMVSHEPSGRSTPPALLF